MTVRVVDSLIEQIQEEIASIKVDREALELFVTSLKSSMKVMKTGERNIERLLQMSLVMTAQIHKPASSFLYDEMLIPEFDIKTMRAITVPKSRRKPELVVAGTQ